MVKVIGKREPIYIERKELRAFSTLKPMRLYSPEQPPMDLPPIKGIREFGGPYDFLTDDLRLKRAFDRIEVWGFYPKEYKEIKDALEILLSEYLEKSYYGEGEGDEDFYGFKEEFKVDFITHDVLEYERGKLKDSINAYNLYPELEKAMENKSRVVVVVGGPTHKSVKVNREYYLEAKRVFLNELDISCQFASYYAMAEGRGILYKVLRRERGAKEKGLGDAIWNFALDMYGKVGGIAWAVLQRISDSKVIDLTIGFRFARIMERRGYCVGCVTIIDRFGRLVGAIPHPPFRGEIRTEGMRIPKNVMETLTSMAIERVKSDKRLSGLLDVDRKINIVVHRTNGFFDEEIEGIEAAIASTIDEYNLGLVALTVRPPLWSYNTKVSGVMEGRGYQINKNTALLYTIRGVDRFVYPIGVTIYKRGPFSSIEEVCSHILALAALHWQTVIPNVKMPASVEFAGKIARFYARGIRPREGSWLWQTLWFI